MVECSLQWPEHTFSCDAANVKNMAKFYVPTWSIFVRAVT